MRWLLLALCCASCAGSPTHPSPQDPPAPAVTIVRLNVRVLSADHYITIAGAPYYAPFVGESAELVGALVDGEQAVKVTSDQGAVSWRVQTGVRYKVKVRNTEYFGTTPLGGDADWILYVCGIDLPGTLRIPDLRVDC